MKILETSRLYLRRMTIEDAGNIYLLNLDPEVIQCTGDVAFESLASAQHFLTHYDHYDKYDFGRWAVIEKNSQAFLGWCGLKFNPKSEECDIGFRFHKKYWNQGYATEAALGCIALGFEKYKMPRIVGRARKDNTSSIKVLEKIGLTYLEAYDFEGNEGVLYQILKP